MAYTIRTRDGRLTICTFDPDAAAERLVELQLMGYSVDVCDFNGVMHGVTSLLAAADGLAAAERAFA